MHSYFKNAIQTINFVEKEYGLKIGILNFKKKISSPKPKRRNEIWQRKDDAAK